MVLKIIPTDFLYRRISFGAEGGEREIKRNRLIKREKEREKGRQKKNLIKKESCHISLFTF